ncbi:DeoR/GlpR family DNA-binding transcription regulator [Breznakiella homolactica]|uniref:DeoR/GlpR transcriptional regulator n=1 Tax=Breznakiella homolactica TaxID=2798577 RepID=A0A7T7XN97_9SPIR|nr:DeoR/GlpR family DNA-binding transcription regulator [Breznakiella homolactica]QQO09446.1 DeoR/GlpR family DNA-binding transcription regulator [Breznakiella homolactica]
MENLNSRQRQLVELVQSFHFMTIKQLALKLQVSEMTIRRDIILLSEKKLITQVYGGVTAVEPEEAEKNYSIAQAQSHNTNLKYRMALKAVEMLGPGEVVFLDSGTTIQTMAEQIPSDAAHTLITASFNTLEVIVKLQNCTVISPGGVYAPKPRMFYNHDSADFIKRYRATKCFIGTTGYDIALGLTCGYQEDVPLKQAMIQSSKEKILLLDSSKYDKVSTHVFAKIEDFSMVITDDGISEEYASFIREKGITLAIV